MDQFFTGVQVQLVRVPGAAPGRRGVAQTLRSQWAAAGTRRALRVKGMRQRERAALQGRVQEKQASSLIYALSSGRFFKEEFQIKLMRNFFQAFPVRSVWHSLRSKISPRHARQDRARRRGQALQVGNLANGHAFSFKRIIHFMRGSI